MAAGRLRALSPLSCRGRGRSPARQRRAYPISHRPNRDRDTIQDIWEHHTLIHIVTNGNKRLVLTRYHFTIFRYTIKFIKVATWM